MGALTDNKYDVYNWIKRVIDSTTTIKQFQNAKNLIRLFRKKYDDFELYEEVGYYASDHLSSLIKIIKNKTK